MLRVLSDSLYRLDILNSQNKNTKTRLKILHSWRSKKIVRMVQSPFWNIFKYIDVVATFEDT
jgi:hypothetical protein